MGIGSALQKLIRNRNLSVPEVARAAKVSPSMLYSMISRDSVSANIGELSKVASVLDVTLDYFAPYVQSRDSRTAEDEMSLATNRNRSADTTMHRDEARHLHNVPENEFFLSKAPNALMPGSCTPSEPGDAAIIRANCTFHEVLDDSMAPIIRRHDIAVVRPDLEVRPGDLGVFGIAGREEIRRMINGALIANDANYAPVLLEAQGDVIPLGRVVGKISWNTCLH